LVLVKADFESWICYEHDRFLVINKPAGISSLHERSEEAPTVIEQLKDFNPNYQLCHRIDKYTSGLLLISKDNDTYKYLSQLFENRLITKYYQCFVWGVPHWDETTVSLPLAPAKKGLTKVDYKKGKPSITHLKVLKRFRRTALIEAQPVSGRLHQIRVHLSSSGFQILADESYGGKLPFVSDFKRKYKQSARPASPMIDRLALHAAGMRFDLFGETFNIQTEMPDDMKLLNKLLERNDA
jgi:RluA family pseudouridine synthase